NVWHLPEQTDYLSAAKGAPEAIADLCNFHALGRAELEAHVRQMASDGLRVLGVAEVTTDRIPVTIESMTFTFLGLIGLKDPVRPTVPGAVAECHRAGIRVVMLTGDYPVTAQSIAAEVGLRPTDVVMTGAELDRLEDAALAQRTRAVSIFARVRPEQKLRLVRAFQADGEIVAMTG